MVTKISHLTRRKQEFLDWWNNIMSPVVTASLVERGFPEDSDDNKSKALNTARLFKMPGSKLRMEVEDNVGVYNYLLSLLYKAERLTERTRETTRQIDKISQLKETRSNRR